MKVIVLTKSSKHGGLCVAGIDAENGQWIRLVSNNSSTHGALMYEDIIYEDGSEMQILDIVDVEIIGKENNPIQPENYIINSNFYFKLRGRSELRDVLTLHPCEKLPAILGNYNCYVPETDIGKVGYSLTMIQVKNLFIHQVHNPSGAPKTKASFFYNGYNYSRMPVTDSKFYSVSDGKYYSEAILIMSIGTPYNSNYYKFIAAILV